MIKELDNNNKLERKLLEARTSTDIPYTNNLMEQNNNTLELVLSFLRLQKEYINYCNIFTVNPHYDRRTENLLNCKLTKWNEIDNRFLIYTFSQISHIRFILPSYRQQYYTDLEEQDDTIEKELKRKHTHEIKKLEEYEDSSSSDSSDSNSSDSSTDSSDSEKEMEGISMDRAREHMLNNLRNGLKKRYINKN